MKKSAISRVIQLLKLGVPVAIIAWLLTSIDPEKWQQLQDQPKNWLYLGVAFVVAFAAILTSFARWFVLVRVVDIPIKFHEALRLSFLGFLLSFVSVGSVGGDLFKAVFLAKNHRGRRTGAVASVFVDRVIGLYALLLVASCALLFSDVTSGSEGLTVLANLIYVATVAGGFCIVLVMLPAVTNGKLAHRLTGIPKVGRLLAQAMSALQVYRQRRLALLLTVGMSVAVQGMLSFSIWLAAIALFDQVPSLGEHFIIMPISLVVAALPVSPAGLGTFEYALNKLYEIITGPNGVPGVTVALVFRLVTIGVAAVGILFFWAGRKEVHEIAEEVDKKERTTEDRSVDEESRPRR